MSNVHAWFNQKTAEILLDFKNASDVFGEPLLDRTVIPFVTDVSEASNARSPLPALIFGGWKLGFQGGQFQEVRRHSNDLWLTLSQAFFPDVEDPRAPFAEDAFVTSSTTATLRGVIPGLWERP